jgi:hypothetical protein
MWPTVPVVCPGGFDFTGVEALRFGEFEALDAGDVEGHPAVAVRRVGHGFLRRWCRADARATKMSRSTERSPSGCGSSRIAAKGGEGSPGMAAERSPFIEFPPKTDVNPDVGLAVCLRRASECRPQRSVAGVRAHVHVQGR